MKAYNKMPQVPENVEQINLFRWATLQESKYPELILLHHIPNGGKRSITTAKRLKMEGVKSGVPDICLPVSRGGYNGMYIELKAGKNKTSENQDFWLTELSKQGYYCNVCWGWEEASKKILNYLKGAERRENNIHYKP